MKTTTIKISNNAGLTHFQQDEILRKVKEITDIYDKVMAGAGPEYGKTKVEIFPNEENNPMKTNIAPIVAYRIYKNDNILLSNSNLEDALCIFACLVEGSLEEYETLKRAGRVSIGSDVYSLDTKNLQ